MKKMLLMMALMSLTACDALNRHDVSLERKNSLYRSAMADYHAGRIDAAISGFQNVVVRDPANSSARFQLACLLQDVKHDAKGAYCAFCEYLSQSPDSDKSAVASKRLAACEEDLAKQLAAKYGLLDKDNLIKELDVLRGELKMAREAIATAEKHSREQETKIVALVEERERLVKAVKGVSLAEGDAVSRPSKVEVKSLLEEEEDLSGDRIRMSADIAALRQEEADERTPGPSLIAPRRADDVAARKAADAQRSARKEAEEAALRGPSHPPTYVVQDGDTLFRIAARFYGRISAWQIIRDANKARVSNDGRVRTGDTLVLP